MRVLYLEPFEGGSHAAFTRALTRPSEADDAPSWTVHTLPARHWKWRMRGSAAHFADMLDGADLDAIDCLFASAYLPLAELVGLCPQLARMPRILFFHENQLAFPVYGEGRSEAEPVAMASEQGRDLHFAFTQLVSALAATRCVFNSEFNRSSFLEHGAALLRRMPDAVPDGWIEGITERSVVLGLPLELPLVSESDLVDSAAEREHGPLIVWNHRWERDKGPAALLRILEGLVARRVRFRLAVCGRRFRRVPSEFDLIKARFGGRIETWGWLDDRREYESLLARAQIVLSTAQHEFFGISVLEAVHAGARPCVPDRLAYRELIPDEFRYANEDDAIEQLAAMCAGWAAGEFDLRADRRALTRAYAHQSMLPRYWDLIAGEVDRAREPSATAP